MTILELMLNLLILQGLLGAWDTLYHHELRCALPRQPSAVKELRLHAVRSVLYGVVFAGLAWWQWGGAWLVVFWAIIFLEIGLTLLDFIEEDQSRRLPASERVLHTVLAINGGALLGMLASLSPQWWQLASQLHIVNYGWKSWLLSALALGVVLSGLRDGLASRALSRAPAAPQFSFRAIDEPHRALSFLITGGTGFIGQSLVRALLADGHSVTLFSRDPLKAASLFRAQVSCFSDFSQLDEGRVFDIVINLAGEPIMGPRWSEARKARLLASRVQTTERLCAWLAQAHNRPQLMISGSAVGYYGVQTLDDNTLLDENSLPQAIFPSQLCQAWEQAAQAVTKLDIPLVIIRLGVVLGQQGALPAMLLPIRLGAGGPLNGGQQAFAWVHLHDVLGTMAYLCQQAPSAEQQRVYNLVAPQLLSQGQFTQVAAQLLHRPAFLPTPGWVMQLLLGEQATLLLDGQKVVPQRLLEEGYKFHYPTLSAALKQCLHSEKLA